MKTIKYILTLAAVCLLAMNVQAITFVEGDEMFIKADQHSNDGGSWVPSSSQNLYLYIWNSGGDKWVHFEKDNGTIYRAKLPAGTWAEQFILVRTNGTEGWSHKECQTVNLSWYKTCKDDKEKDIPCGFPNKNCLTVFKKDLNEINDKTYTDWGFYSPIATSIPKVKDMNVKEEAVSICPNALEGPYSLRVKLSADKKSYDYDNVTCHAWYCSSDGVNWQAVKEEVNAGKTDRNDEGDKDIIKNNLPKTISANGYYYYLYSSTAAGRRLIKLTPDAEDCELDCKITFFGVATSEVNANDTTYTLDGMVAFGTAAGYGNLVIECDGKSTTIKEAEAKSPQIFSIAGLRAATKDGKTTTAKAYFTGKPEWAKTAEVKIPNATQGITYKHIDVLVGETTPLEPTGANYSNTHIWYIDGEEKPKMQGKQTSMAFDKPNVTRYAYREFNPPSGTMDDLMSNGGYETEDESFYGTKGSKSTISDYNFWGIYPQTGNTAIDFYMNTTINPHKWEDNGFAVVKNANNFFYTFAKVTPREGNYFAIFDAEANAQSGKKAWYATTAKNPNLKLKKGTTYLLSFWAANINNYGEMDNAAKLQFQINGKNFGDPLDLGSAQFRNNRWHQCSATYYADADADNVTISVVNLHASTLNTGNDFALDDIQFRAVSSATRSVRIQQVFEVQTHEPKIYQMTAVAQPMACDETEYEVKIGVEYTNPKGKLVVEDLTTGKKVLNKAVTKPAWDSKTWHRFSIKLDTLTAKEHKFKAYFDEWTKTEAKASSTAPEYSKCCTDGLMFRKWENVIFVNNHDSLYVGYQWFKNGQKLNGETKQRLYTGATSLKGTTDLYHCQLTHKDGTTELTCEKKFDDIPSSAQITAVEDIMVDGFAVYPTQVPAGTAITIIKTVPGTVRATLLSLTGQMAGTMLLTGDENTMLMSGNAGMYLLQLQGKETHSTVKINVY